MLPAEQRATQLVVDELHKRESDCAKRSSNFLQI